MVISARERSAKKPAKQGIAEDTPDSRAYKNQRIHTL